MQKRLVDAETRLVMIRNLLIIEYVGVATGDSGDHPGNEYFRKKLLSIIEDVKAKQSEGLAIAHQTWEVLAGIQIPGHVADEIRRYVGTIKALATEFGLRPNKPSDGWWGYDWLHDVVSQTIQFGTRFYEKRWWPGKGWVESAMIQKFTPSPWERDPWTKKEVVKARLNQEFERDWEISDRVLENSGYVAAAERRLFHHIHWLFLAICPDDQLARPLTYQEIANREFPVPVEDEDKEDEFEGGTDISNVVNEDGSDRSIVTKKDGMDTSTVTKAVLRLAKILGIELGKRTGRQKAIVN